VSDGKDTSKKGKAGQGAAGAVGESYDAPFRGYINLNLSDDQKRAYARWVETASMWEQLEASAADGVHLAVKYSPKEACFLASATQRRVASPNAGLVVTARGKDATTAWGRILYILAVLSKDVKWEATQPMADPDRW